MVNAFPIGDSFGIGAVARVLALSALSLRQQILNGINHGDVLAGGEGCLRRHEVSRAVMNNCDYSLSGLFRCSLGYPYMASADNRLTFLWTVFGHLFGYHRLLLLYLWSC